ncbi:MAG: ABC transporter permease [Spirochaetes bacterium]|nr:MAG: ABC transporter permease [Spirochaetota bacterium]
MKGIIPVVKKELRTYFNSPIAYIVALFFLVFTSVWLYFIQQFLVQNTASLRIYFGIIPTVFIIILPAITMRSWAEERKTGTEEILLTLPFKEIEVVAGKFFGSLMLLCIMVVLTIPVPLTLTPLGDFETGEIVGQYLGTLLLGAAGLALGQFVSSLSVNQISSFIFGVVALLVVTLIRQINFFLSLPSWLADFLNYISLDYHFESFKKGLIDTRDILYFLILVVSFLYFNMKVLVLRKWK